MTLVADEVIAVKQKGGISKVRNVIATGLYGAAKTRDQEANFAINVDGTLQ